jgi:hypothetical protein
VDEIAKHKLVKKLETPQLLVNYLLLLLNVYQKKRDVFTLQFFYMLISLAVWGVMMWLLLLTS